MCVRAISLLLQFERRRSQLYWRIIWHWHRFFATAFIAKISHIQIGTQRSQSRISWPWGLEFSPEKANLWGDRDGSLGVAKVGSYPQGASSYGVMDTVGNVWEWVSDSYVAPGNESKKVRLGIVKGGGWTSAKQQARISSRNIVDPEIKNPTIGFRCAKPMSGKK